MGEQSIPVSETQITKKLSGLFIKTVIEFSNDVICTHENKTYVFTEENMNKRGSLLKNIMLFIRGLYSDEIQIDTKKLCSREFMVDSGLIYEMTRIRFNKIYKSLVRYDHNIHHIFNKLQDNGHSKVCLLFFLFLVTVNIHLNLDRSQLDTTSLESYIESVNVELDRISHDIFEKLVTEEQLLNHECEHVDITTLDPEIDIFENREGFIY